MNNMNTAAVVPWTFQGKEVRTVTLNGETYWIASDVCKILSILNGPQAMQRLEDDEKTTIYLTDSGNLNGSRTIINESGLYSLILRSDKPEAKAFRKWVTSEVLPQIRKTGSYSLKPAIPIPENSDDQILLLCANLTEKIHECRKLKSQIEENLPKVESFNAFLDTAGLVTVRNAAKILLTGEHKLFTILRNAGILDKYNVANQRFIDAGYFTVKPTVYYKGEEKCLHKQTFFTTKGIDYVRRRVLNQKAIDRTCALN